MRLSAGPIESATQPNPDIPTMAAAIEPVLKVVSTRPMRCDGVISWSSANTTGLRTAAPAPTRITNAAAISGDSSRLRVQTASPPTVVPLTRICIRLRTSFFCLRASHEEAVSIPTPRADQSQPSWTGPTCSSSFAYTGRTNTKALAPRLYRADIITNRNTVERSPNTNRNETEGRNEERERIHVEDVLCSDQCNEDPANGRPQYNADVGCALDECI